MTMTNTQLAKRALSVEHRRTLMEFLQPDPLCTQPNPLRIKVILAHPHYDRIGMNNAFVSKRCYMTRRNMCYIINVIIIFR